MLKDENVHKHKYILVIDFKISKSLTYADFFKSEAHKMSEKIYKPVTSKRCMVIQNHTVQHNIL